MNPYSLVARMILVIFLAATPIFVNAQRVVRVGWYAFGNLSTYNAAVRHDENTNDSDIPDLYGGYNYEYLRMISQINGWKLQFIYGTMNESLARLEQGEVDLVGGIARTPERETLFVFPNTSVLRSSIGLIARGDDQRFSMNDVASFEGIRIGAVKGSNPAFRMEEWRQQRHINVNIVYFDAFESMYQALNDGTVDAVTDSLLLSYPNQKILVSMQTNGVYFAVHKGENQLAHELDDALTYIQYLKPGYQEALTAKYFNQQSASDLSLTNAERAYLEKRIASGQPVIVSYNPDWFPIEYKDADSGTMGGMMAAVFERLSQITGLNFKYVTADSYDDTTKRYQGEAEVSATLSTDFSWADQHESYLTQPFFETPVFVVTMPGHTGDNRVALPLGYHLSKAVQARLDKADEEMQYLYFGSVGECLQAVREGKAGRAYINSLELNYYMNQDRYSMLKIQAVPNFTESTSIGISKDADPVLFSILCKALRSISPAEMNNIILNTTKAKADSNVTDMLYVHPIAFIALAMIFVLLASGLVFFYFNSRHSEKMRRELEIANRAKTDFLSRMSHDIRTPMNAIIGLTEIAAKNTEAESVKDSLAKIDHSGQFLLRLINDILDISRIESENFVLFDEPYTQQEFLTFIESTVVPLADAKGLHFTYKLMDSVPCLSVDKLRFNQIFTNLLGNAIKFTPSGGHISMVLEDDGIIQEKQYFTAIISDDGIGISASFLPHIFDSFVQENDTHTREDEGTGLGLAIVKKIVDAMGGTIEVQSEKGKGTTFTLHLMFGCVAVTTTADSENQAATPLLAESSLPVFLLKDKHVLIVEDNEINQEVAKAQLEAVGIICDIANNGQEALTLFMGKDEYHYDVILMDIRMPVLDGKEATRRLRASGRQDALTVPIIALTADAFADTRNDIMECGMNACVSKPVHSETLYAALLNELA